MKNAGVLIKEYFHKNGQLSLRQKLLNDQLHCLDDPAHESYYENGMPDMHVWFKYGRFYRLDGPAFERYGADGKLVFAEYWIEDRHLTKEEHMREALFIKLREKLPSEVEVSL